MDDKNQTAGLMEISTFKLHQGIHAEEFIMAAASMEEVFLRKQHGFVKRTLTLSGDGRWIDIVHWQDQQSFEEAMKLADGHQHTAPFLEMIDFNSVTMTLASPMLTSK